MKTSKLIALHKSTDGSYGYQNGTIYIICVMPSIKQVEAHPLRPLAIKRVSPWYNFWATDGYRTYATWDQFTTDWEVLEQL